MTSPTFTAATRLSTRIKILYGAGDWARSSFNTLRQLFYAIFLTDVVGLDPRLASLAALIALLWDAINDPLVGSFSDRVRTRWGRRRPFLLIFTVPLAAAFVLMWWAPPWKSDLALLAHVTLAFMVADTIQTLVTVPYLSLTPELAPDYDQRTSLTSFRMFFNLLASLATAVAAPDILDATINAGMSLQQGYLIVAALFGGLAMIPLFLIFLFVREQKQEEVPVEAAKPSLIENIRQLWQNKPFRYAMGIYVINWASFDLVALMLPFFLLYWVSSGDLLASYPILGMKLSIESAVLGILLVVATAVVPFWNWVAQKTSKRAAYLVGMLFWIGVEFFVLAIQPGQTTMILIFAVLAGISVSTAHIMPEALFPDVIDWDELRTNTRREGVYYGAVNFMRKVSTALAVFFALQVLGWFGYQSPPETAALFTQSPITLTAIRWMTGPAVCILLVSAVVLAWFYPLSRERQTRIQRLLHRRRQRQQKVRPVVAPKSPAYGGN